MRDVGTQRKHALLDDEQSRAGEVSRVSYCTSGQMPPRTDRQQFENRVRIVPRQTSERGAADMLAWVRWRASAADLRPLTRVTRCLTARAG